MCAYTHCRGEANRKLKTRQSPPEMWWAVLAQTCVSWPIKEDWTFGGGGGIFKKQELQSHQNYEPENEHDTVCLLKALHIPYPVDLSLGMYIFSICYGYPGKCLLRCLRMFNYVQPALKGRSSVDHLHIRLHTIQGFTPAWVYLASIWSQLMYPMRLLMYTVISIKSMTLYHGSTLHAFATWKSAWGVKPLSGAT